MKSRQKRTEFFANDLNPCGLPRILGNAKMGGFRQSARDTVVNHASVWNTPPLIQHSQLLLDSYERWLGQPLIPREGDYAAQAQRLFEAPFVVVSHGTQADPVLNYGNKFALTLWELDMKTLTQTPSRLTAEPVHRDERSRLLARTTRDGFVDDYQGIRISHSGKRFQIDRAIVWNLVGEHEQFAGQAATFSNWRYLD